MNKAVLLIIALCFSCVSNNLFAQKIKVEGIVFNKRTGLPIGNTLVKIKGTKTSFFNEDSGRFKVEADTNQVLIFSCFNFHTVEIQIVGKDPIKVGLEPSIKDTRNNLVSSDKKNNKASSARIAVNPAQYETVTEQVLAKAESTRIVQTPEGPREEVIPAQFKTITKQVIVTPAASRASRSLSNSPLFKTQTHPGPYYGTRSSKLPCSNESYSEIKENIFKEVSENPLSTFSLDVDAAAYSNVRRYLNRGHQPPKNAVRVEEMINYFNYDYPQPNNEVPFSINTEIANCPWNEDNLLLHVGLQGKEISTDKLPASNIVFLIDVSGSMNSMNKLPLLKSSFEMLVKNLRKKDRVAIVAYAGASGLVLESTRGNQKGKIIEALGKLKAGGSTAGGAGLKLAYKVALENLIKKGNNRIVLATDGDFNVGVSGDDGMKKLVEENRDKGIAISVLGFGTGNLKDSKMEIIADHGNGNYAYIDNILEAKKTLVKEFGGTFHTIAKDVKFQLDFNPEHVESYRLIGYENRLLENKDFEDDKKDAGEIGSGHNVTALYEIKLKADSKQPEKRKYHTSELANPTDADAVLITLKLRYKQPKGTKSTLVEESIKYSTVSQNQVTNNFHFSAAVVEFGMLLRDSDFKGTTNWDDAIELATRSKGPDKEGYRAEMIALMEGAKVLLERTALEGGVK